MRIHSQVPKRQGGVMLLEALIGLLAFMALALIRIPMAFAMGIVGFVGIAYKLNFNVVVNNLFNHVNQGGFVGNLSSPLFGQSTALNLYRDTSNNRRVQFGTQLSF